MPLDDIPALADQENLVRAVAQVDQQGNFSDGTSQLFSEILLQLKMMNEQLCLITGAHFTINDIED